MNYKLSLLIFLLLSSCHSNPTPSYNPFDEEKKISIKTLLGDGCKLLYAPCGYRTYGKEVDGNVIYYQFNPGEEHEICAKGICIHIDTTEVEPNLIIDANLSRQKERVLLIEKVLSEAIDSSRITVPLLKFGVRNIPYQEMEIDSSLFFEAYLQDINTGVDPSERAWFFIDQKEHTYSAQLDFKIEQDSNNRSIMIRTLELFNTQKRTH